MYRNMFQIKFIDSRLVIHAIGLCFMSGRPTSLLYGGLFMRKAGKLILTSLNYGFC